MKKGTFILAKILALGLGAREVHSRHILYEWKNEMNKNKYNYRKSLYIQRNLLRVTNSMFISKHLNSTYSVSDSILSTLYIFFQFVDEKTTCRKVEKLI